VKDSDFLNGVAYIQKNKALFEILLSSECGGESQKWHNQYGWNAL